MKTTHWLAALATVMLLAWPGSGHTKKTLPIKAVPMSSVNKSMPPLTPEEAHVMLNKGTERPYTGALLDNKEEGVYVCRKCGEPLFRSQDKFDSGTGWPSFDDALPGAVARHSDPDGMRTEIVCAACNGHLGHVFEGEHITDKNTRHCVNSLSLSFLPDTDAVYGHPYRPLERIAEIDSIPLSDEESPLMAAKSCEAVAIFAGGCFWGVEDAFRKVPGVCDAISGYTGGSSANPTYEQVSTGNTGHAEAVQVSYDPAKVSYETLARLFFEIHDPTQVNQQGPDRGTQYRSAVFFADKDQQAVAQKLISELKAKGYDVATEISPLNVFYPAEDYHQDYAERTGRGACHLRVPRFEQNAR